MHRLRACAGSCMSRTTTVGSPTTVPMTRLSPAGTGVAQCTRDAGLGEAVEPGELPPDAVVGATVDVDGDAEGCAGPGPEPPQAARTNIETRAAPLARTA